MTSKQPDIVFFARENPGRGEVGCYGGGVLRGAPTPRIGRLAADGLKLLNFNAQAQCAPNRSAVMTGRASDPLGYPARPDHRGPDGLTQNKYVAEEIDINAYQLAKQIEAAEGS